MAAPHTGLTLLTNQAIWDSDCVEHVIIWRWPGCDLGRGFIAILEVSSCRLGSWSWSPVLRSSGYFYRNARKAEPGMLRRGPLALPWCVSNRLRAAHEGWRMPAERSPRERKILHNHPLPSAFTSAACLACPWASMQGAQGHRHGKWISQGGPEGIHGLSSLPQH